MAMQCLRQARQVCSSDPLIFNELGVVCYNEGKYESAIEAFRHAIELCTDNMEAVLVNLGHSYRKMQKFSDAVECYQRALVLDPRNASTLVALGFTNHLGGNFGHCNRDLPQSVSNETESQFRFGNVVQSIEIIVGGFHSRYNTDADNSNGGRVKSFVSSSFVDGSGSSYAMVGVR